MNFPLWLLRGLQLSVESWILSNLVYCCLKFLMETIIFSINFRINDLMCKTEVNQSFVLIFFLFWPCNSHHPDETFSYLIHAVVQLETTFRNFALKWLIKIWITLVLWNRWCGLWSTILTYFLCTRTRITPMKGTRDQKQKWNPLASLGSLRGRIWGIN